MGPNDRKWPFGQSVSRTNSFFWYNLGSDYHTTLVGASDRKNGLKQV